ncbi:gliding motility-associated C-terminal domain-containing protein [Tenacibaculum sp. 1_MG-2023]|uniref:gliding motility-associated C-terminal domain-containing protein n=1 Tax=Tenacibaculum sp. 1_MG-2023 TaxID=3062653 RepID=UPI0026E23396|nr:gliding motility-associated C-terminal domain-containing protein [Tenacibaculum sp. 1_MG-2023]MDO6675004.1 gliding motility-associated C-terminal domain-containing protein [Tenacibaculum sp. 1_MG-2023]
MKKIIISSIIMCFVIAVKSQVASIGSFYVSENTLVSVYEDVLIKDYGAITNDGDLYLFKNFTNKGKFKFSNNKVTGYTSFVGNDNQTISGKGTSSFMFVEFDNTSTDLAFNLDKEIEINGTTFFENGIIEVSEKGIVTYLNGATNIGVSNKSYVNNKAQKIGNESFTFPIGDYQSKTFVPRTVTISAPLSLSTIFFVAFNWEKANIDFDKKEEDIGLIDMNEFWDIQNKSNDELVNLTLTWNIVTTPEDVYSDPSKLMIVRWNGEKWIKERENIKIDASNKSITAKVSGYGVFTLANDKKRGTIDSVIDFSTSNSFSPNNDGVNDEFVIPDLAEKYPKFKMKIYNRYGSVVYSYSNNNELNPVWWNGKSQGKLTLTGDTEVMPAATYWYVVDFNDEKTKPYQGWLYLNK